MTTAVTCADTACSAAPGKEVNHQDDAAPAVTTLSRLNPPPPHRFIDRPCRDVTARRCRYDLDERCGDPAGGLAGAGRAGRGAVQSGVGGRVAAGGAGDRGRGRHREDPAARRAEGAVRAAAAVVPDRVVPADPGTVSAGTRARGGSDPR